MVYEVFGFDKSAAAASETDYADEITRAFARMIHLDGSDGTLKSCTENGIAQLHPNNNNFAAKVAEQLGTSASVETVETDEKCSIMAAQTAKKRTMENAKMLHCNAQEEVMEGKSPPSSGSSSSQQSPRKIRRQIALENEHFQSMKGEAIKDQTVMIKDQQQVIKDQRTTGGFGTKQRMAKRLGGSGRNGDFGGAIEPKPNKPIKMFNREKAQNPQEVIGNSFQPRHNRAFVTALSAAERQISDSNGQWTKNASRSGNVHAKAELSAKPAQGGFGGYDRTFANGNGQQKASTYNGMPAADRRQFFSRTEAAPRGNFHMPQGNDFQPNGRWNNYGGNGGYDESRTSSSKAMQMRQRENVRTFEQENGGDGMRGTADHHHSRTVLSTDYRQNGSQQYANSNNADYRMPQKPSWKYRNNGAGGDGQEEYFCS